MNYRHAFHAGNFADVHKHVVLLALLEHLHKKPAPFFVLDTHAGRGEYDLQSPEAQRGGEWQGGIKRIRSAHASVSPLLARYLHTVGLTGNTYPGSPLIAVAMLREIDRAVFVEKHPEEALTLTRALGRRRRTSVLTGDGYDALKAHLPPKENRGLVLIDPPYESDTEFADVATAAQSSHKRWPTGIYAVWYPIKPGNAEQRLYRALKESGLRKVMIATLNIRPSDSPLGLNGSGMVIVNPPWQFDNSMREVLPEMHRILAEDGAGGVRVEWLVGE